MKIEFEMDDNSTIASLFVCLLILGCIALFTVTGYFKHKVSSFTEAGYSEVQLEGSSCTRWIAPEK